MSIKGPGKNENYHLPRKFISFEALFVHVWMFRDQSFTSLMADLRQDINGCFAFFAGALMGHFHEGSAPLRLC